MNRPIPQPVIHSPEICFSGNLRRFVLGQALKRDKYGFMINNAKQLVSLKRVKGKEYTCSCPWCGSEQGFIVNKKTGACTCSSCEKKGDLIDLILESQGCSIYEIIGYLNGFWKVGDEV